MTDPEKPPATPDQLLAAGALVSAEQLLQTVPRPTFGQVRSLLEAVDTSDVGRSGLTQYGRPVVAEAPDGWGDPIIAEKVAMLRHMPARMPVLRDARAEDIPFMLLGAERRAHQRLERYRLINAFGQVTTTEQFSHLAEGAIPYFLNLPAVVYTHEDERPRALWHGVATNLGRILETTPDMDKKAKAIEVLGMTIRRQGSHHRELCFEVTMEHAAKHPQLAAVLIDNAENSDDPLYYDIAAASRTGTDGPASVFVDLVDSQRQEDGSIRRSDTVNPIHLRETCMRVIGHWFKETGLAPKPVLDAIGDSRPSREWDSQQFINVANQMAGIANEHSQTDLPTNMSLRNEANLPRAYATILEVIRRRTGQDTGEASRAVPFLEAAADILRLRGPNLRELLRMLEARDASDEEIAEEVRRRDATVTARDLERLSKPVDAAGTVRGYFQRNQRQKP